MLSGQSAAQGRDGRLGWAGGDDGVRGADALGDGAGGAGRRRVRRHEVLEVETDRAEV